MSTCKWRLKPGDSIEYTDRLDPSRKLRTRVFERYDSRFPGLGWVRQPGRNEAYVYISDLTFTKIIKRPRMENS